MKLVYAKGACSFSVHILLEELGKKYETLKVSLRDKAVLETYTSKSYVPVLVLDNGEILTEAAAILQYLAEVNARFDLLPEPGSFAKARCIEWLTYFSSELHKGLGPLFRREQLSETHLKTILTKIDKRFRLVDEHLEKRKFLMGDEFTIADMYAIAILRIAGHVKIDFTAFPNIIRYQRELEGMPLIKKVSEVEDKEVLARAA